MREHTKLGLFACWSSLQDCSSKVIRIKNWCLVRTGSGFTRGRASWDSALQGFSLVTSILV